MPDPNGEESLDQRLQKQEEEHTKKLMELENEKREMRKKWNEQELMMQEKEFEFRQLKTESLQKLTNALSEKEVYNDFRSSCLKVIRKFQKFQKLFKRGKNATDRAPERMMGALEALRILARSVLSLKILPQHRELEICQKSILEECENLKKIIVEIVVELEDGESDEELDKDLKEHYNLAEKTIQELESMIENFNIPTSQQFESTMMYLDKNFKKTSDALDNEKIGTTCVIS